MNLQLDGKRALVTGSSAGIGYAIAGGLAAEGAAVAVNGRDGDRVEQAASAIEADNTGVSVERVVADLGTRKGVETLCEQVPELDILVNNLSLFGPREFTSIDDDEWQHFFDVNLMSGVRLSRHYLPAMEDRGWGRILFVSSESGVHIPPEMIHYGVTKAAQLALARGLAEATGDSGVTVNSILPGPTRSEGLEGFLKEMAGRANQSLEEFERGFIAENRPSSLIGRLAETEEVANLAVYLCSPLASATTGAPMRVDGGVVRAMS